FTLSADPLYFATSWPCSDGWQLNDTPDVPQAMLLVSLGLFGGPNPPAESMAGTLTVAIALSPNWLTVIPLAVSLSVTHVAVQALAFSPPAVKKVALSGAGYA